MKALRVFFYIIIGLAVIFYVTVTVSEPLRKVKEINNIALSDSNFMRKSKAIAKYEGLFPLVKEKAYKEALVTLSQQDSIGLIIDFRDSTASLMLKGVKIQKSKIVDYKRDKIFDGIDAPAFRKLFSRPLHNIHDFSTFVLCLRHLSLICIFRNIPAPKEFYAELKKLYPDYAYLICFAYLELCRYKM